jgi:poly-beta-1,6-N-acetyl-D-glucosamine synthase
LLENILTIVPGEVNLLSTAEMDAPHYVVITPVRNESAFIEKTLTSMIHQTVCPVEWVIVNDGSSDGTEAIVTKWAQSHPWIRLVNRTDRGARQRGQGVIEAFYAGYEALTEAFDYIVKLDGDVSFGSAYFMSLIEKFAANPRLGIAGGGVYESLDGKAWALYTTKDHVRGATKMYRRACFEAIGGLAPAMGWDGIDEWKALSLGWQVESFLQFPMYHYRFTGAATGFLKSCIEQGNGAYRIGYHPLYMIARGIRRMTDRPYVLGGLAMAAAYFGAWLRQDEMLADPSLVRYVRRTQMRKLLGLFEGKPVRE